MIKTKSVYKPKSKDDGKRILISRLHPRGVKKSQYHFWFKELSPSLSLIHEYKQGKISWKNFFSKYKKELVANPESIEKIKFIRKESKENSVTLICFEPEGEPYHRHILKEIVKKQKLLKESFVPEFVDD